MPNSLTRTARPAAKILESVAAYKQIAHEIRGQIHSGRLVPGGALESEAAMRRTWGVSRSTVRRALQELSGEGLLSPRQGLGWFVTEPRMHQRLAKLEPLSDALTKQGVDAHIALRKFQFGEMPESVTSALELDVGACGLEITRIHLSGKTPLAIVQIWLVESVGTRISVEDATRGPVFPILPNRAGVRVTWSQQAIRAVALADSDAKALNLRPRDPAIHVLRTSYTANDVPIAYASFLYRADSFELRIRLDWQYDSLGEPLSETGIGYRESREADSARAGNRQSENRVAERTG